MREELAGAGFGESHEMFDFHVVIEFGLLVIRERGRLLALDQIPYPCARRLGGFEIHHFARAQRSNKLDEFFVRSHAGSLPLSRWPDKRVGGALFKIKILRMLAGRGGFVYEGRP